MKRTFIILIILSLSLLTLQAQSNLFLPFGQERSKVKRFLASRNYVRQTTEDHEQSTLRAIINEYKYVEYAFGTKGMYATTVTTHYRNKGEMREYQRNILDYMDHVSRGSIRQSEESAVVCYSAESESRVIKLFVIRKGSGHTLTLTSLSREHVPQPMNHNFSYEEGLLERSANSNK